MIRRGLPALIRLDAILWASALCRSIWLQVRKKTAGLAPGGSAMGKQSVYFASGAAAATGWAERS
jgi:hypothetical protein